MLEIDVIFSKFSIIRNCLKTILKVTENNPEKLDDYIVQDVFVLNLQRAVQASIDCANVVISIRGLQLPASYKQSFQILEKNNIINSGLCLKMTKMTGFRNIAVHDYQQLDIAVLKGILVNNLHDLEDFIEVVSESISDIK
jgi:uncharacterized protein YutE (UPF0331/DUF86 family)